MRLFRFFESLLEPTAVPSETTPPPGLAAFYWHYARQARWLVGALFCAGFVVAVLDSTIPVFIGRVVGLVASHDPAALWRDSVNEPTDAFPRQQRVITLFSLSLASLNALMVVGTGGMAVWLWMNQSITVGVVAMALPLTWQIANIAGWVAQNVTAIFENVGVVQDGMRSIAVPRQMRDRPDAVELKVNRGAIRFE